MKKYLARVPATLTLGLAAAVLLVTQVTPLAMASTPLAIEPSTTGGDVRNLAHFSLKVTGDTIAQSNIRVLNTDDTAVEIDSVPVQAVDKTGTVSLLRLDWDTTKVKDGQYKIEYSARGNNEQLRYQVALMNVVNDKPLVTLNQINEGREITGTVSRKDTIFRTLLGGQELQVQPTIASDPSADGVYAWSVTVPDTIADGTYSLEARAKPLINGSESDAAFLQSVTITTLPITAPVVSSPDPVVQTPPVLPFVQEIGQFIAPIINTVTSAVQTKFFGVPVSDIVPETRQNNLAPSVSSSTGEVLGASNSKQQSIDTAPVRATEKGWEIMGVPWYWVLGYAALATTAIYWIVRGIRRSISTSQFVSEQRTL